MSSDCRSFSKRAKTKCTTQKIVCLASSRKKSGRCIVGKEIVPSGHGGWIRPVSGRPDGEISEDERRFEDGKYPQVLDVVTIPMKQPQPHHYQQENHLIDDGYYWVKLKKSIDWGELHNIADNVANELWVNGYSDSNDRMPEGVANDLKSSLLLVSPDTLRVSSDFEFGKRKVRVAFFLNGHKYKLAVTDPKIESIYLAKKIGDYEIDASKVYMCISIGEPFNGYCYKLVASIIFNNR